jgi:hypothetical protein
MHKLVIAAGVLGAVALVLLPKSIDARTKRAEASSSVSTATVAPDQELGKLFHFDAANLPPPKTTRGHERSIASAIREPVPAGPGWLRGNFVFLL